MTSSGDAPSLGPELTFLEVRQLVEAVSPAIGLEHEEEGTAENARGRFLVARRDIKAGEVFLSECPLFCGGNEGERSRKAYVEDFLALLDEDPDVEEDVDFDEDCLHPRSPLTDCVAGIVRAKWEALRSEDEQERAEAALRVRKLSCLCRVGLPDVVHEDCAKDCFGVLRPELREVTSEEEVHRFLVTLCSNRFGGADSKLDLMFAGSMFEHSCAPNCFVGTWRGTPAHGPRSYRALRDISTGEALSIDYLHMPDAYLPVAGRAELLGRWGFSCSCHRCKSSPELTRCFACPFCGAGELLPQQPGVEGGLECLACGRAADQGYADRCFAREAEVLGSDLSEPATGSKDELLGECHCTAFAGAWTRVADGLAAAQSLRAFRTDVQFLVDALHRLHGDPRHPHLLDFYHMLAQLAHNDLKEQMHFLELERGVLRKFYAEEAERLDEEIMHLVQSRGPYSPAKDAAGAATEDFSGVDFGEWSAPMDLQGMD